MFKLYCRLNLYINETKRERRFTEQKFQPTKHKKKGGTQFIYTHNWDSVVFSFPNVRITFVRRFQSGVLPFSRVVYLVDSLQFYVNVFI